MTSRRPFGRGVVAATLLLALVFAACSGQTVSLPAEPTAVPTATDNDTDGTSDRGDNAATPAQVLTDIQEAAARTAGSSGDFTFSSITSFDGGQVEVSMGGVFDQPAKASAFDVFITEPDPAEPTAAVESTRSYVFVDGSAFYKDDALDEWTLFEAGLALEDPQIAQGLFVDPTTPGGPPLLHLLDSATNPQAVAAEDNGDVTGATEYLVDIPISEAYRALGGASYAAFVDDGVDPAGFEGDVPGRVQLDEDGHVRAFIVDLTEIFRLAGADPATPADEAALMLELEIVMQVRLMEVGEDVSVSRPIPEPGRIDGFFQVGQCYGDVQLVALNISELPCDEPHLYEIYEVRVRPEPEGAPYPGDSEVFDASLSDCRDRFAEIYGLPDQTTTVEIFVVYPSRDTWASGDREIACAGQLPLLSELVLGSFDLQRSFGVVTTYGLLPGDCFEETVDFGYVGVPSVDCADEHTYEVYHREQLTEAVYPGDEEIEEIADDICVAQFLEFVGVDEGLSQHDYTFFWPSAFGWLELDDRTVTCMVEAAEPVEGSLEGAKK